MMILNSAVSLLLLAFTMLTNVNSESTPNNITLTVSVEGLRNSDGNVLLSLYKDGDGFPDNSAKAVASKGKPANGGTVTFTFENLSPGKYAISGIHDENDNKEMDTNMLGIPKEGIAISNINKKIMSSPSYKDAAFEVSEEDDSFTINVVYY